MKPNWKDAPEWARYLAQNKNGTWCWYENEPYRDFDMWKNIGGKCTQCTAEGWGHTLDWRNASAYILSRKRNAKNKYQPTKN